MRLRFLPPYCPNDNRIERLWLDLRAEAIRNDQRDNVDDLMKDVRRFIRRGGGWRQTLVRRRARRVNTQWHAVADGGLDNVLEITRTHGTRGLLLRLARGTI